MKSNPIFGFLIPIFPFQYATFTELSLTIRGVSYSLPCKTVALFGPLKNVLGVKGEDLTHLANRPQWNTHTHRRNTFWGCTERKCTLLRVSCGRVEGTKNKKIKSTRGYNFTHMPTPPQLSAATIFCMCCRTVDIITHARFQVNRFRGGPKMTWHIALTTVTAVYALTCYTVIKIVNFRNL